MFLVLLTVLLRASLLHGEAIRTTLVDLSRLAGIPWRVSRVGTGR